MKSFRHKLKQFTVNQLGLPDDVILDLPRITIIGFYQIYIENYKGVIQFNDQFLHIKVSNKEMKIYGQNLVIRKVWTEEIFVEGNIKGIQYLE